MYKSRILSDKTRVSCAEMLLDTIQQQRYMTSPQYSNPQQLFTWNNKKKEDCLSASIVDQHAHLSVYTKRIKKNKVQILFFRTATNESKDGSLLRWDINNKRFFPEIIIQARNVMRNLTTSIVYYSQTQVWSKPIKKIICCSCMHNNESS